MAANTPFIPPLLTPSSSGRSLNAPDSPFLNQGRPPLLSPNAPIPPHIAAAWGQQQQQPSGQPPMHRRAHSSPWTVPRGAPHDVNSMSTEDFLRSQPQPNVTTTWVGMDSHGYSPYAPQQTFGNTPVHPPASLMASPPPQAANLGAPWGQPPPQQAQPHNTPMMGYGYNGPPPAQFQAAYNTPMGGPPPQVWATPAGWGAAPPMATPYDYPPQLGMQGMPPNAMGGMQMNMGGYGMLPPQHGMGGMGGMGGPPPQQQRPSMAPIPPGDSGDKIDHFLEGQGYGPVLDTPLLKRLGATLKIHPLLCPPPEDGSDAVHLEWNMLFESTFVKRSSDPPRTSWSAGRGAPATFPRVTSLRLIARPLPWAINVIASNKDAGVTCGDVIEQIAKNLVKTSGQADYKCQTHARQIELGQFYRRHREIGHDVPGGRLGTGMLRLDWLGKTPQWGGIIVPKSTFVKERCGVKSLPGTFELRCIRWLPRTEQERADAEAAAASAAAAGIGRSRSRSVEPPPRSSASSSTGSSPIDIGIISPAPSNNSHASHASHASHTSQRSRIVTPGPPRSRRLSQETASSSSTTR